MTYRKHGDDIVLMWLTPRNDQKDGLIALVKPDKELWAAVHGGRRIRTGSSFFAMPLGDSDKPNGKMMACNMNAMNKEMAKHPKFVLVLKNF